MLGIGALDSTLTERRRLREPCGNQFRTVLHSAAQLPQRAPAISFKHKWLQRQTRTTNQGVVGSNPAGRANQSRACNHCRPFHLAAVAGNVATFPVLHDA